MAVEGLVSLGVREGFLAKKGYQILVRVAIVACCNGLLLLSTVRGWRGIPINISTRGSRLWCEDEEPIRIVRDEVGNVSRVLP